MAMKKPVKKSVKKTVNKPRNGESLSNYMKNVEQDSSLYTQDFRSRKAAIGSMKSNSPSGSTRFASSVKRPNAFMTPVKDKSRTKGKK